MAYDIRIGGVELSVPLAKIGKAGLDGRCERSVSAMLGHLLTTCLQPFKIHHKSCIPFSFIKALSLLRAGGSDGLGLGQTKVKWKFLEIHGRNQGSNCTWVGVASRAIE